MDISVEKMAAVVKYMNTINVMIGNVIIMEGIVVVMKVIGILGK